MSLQIRVHGGTPKSGKSICHTCKHAKIVRGQNCEERIICSAGLWANSMISAMGVVRFRVAECGSYHPSNMPWKHEMEEMAWMIEARRRGPSGFQSNEPLEVIITPPKERDIGVPDF